MKTETRTHFINAILLSVISAFIITTGTFVIQAGAKASPMLVSNQVAGGVEKRPTFHTYEDYLKTNWAEEIKIHRTAVAVLKNYKSYSQGKMSAAALRLSARDSLSQIAAMNRTLDKMKVPVLYRPFNTLIRETLSSEAVCLRFLVTSHGVNIAVSADQLSKMIGQFDLTAESIPTPQ